MQCSAVTRSGNQCTRFTKNSLCYQHNTLLSFQNLENLRTVKINFDDKEIIISLKYAPDPTITIISTQVDEVPKFLGTSTLLIDNLDITSISMIPSLTRISANNTLIKEI